MASGGGNPKKPVFEQYSAPDLSNTIGKFIDQKNQYPGMQDNISESAFVSLMAKNQMFPGYGGTLGQAWQLAQSRGQGLVDAETAQRVSQMAAQSGFATGAGPGSEQTGLQAAKHYGLTAMGLQNSGTQAGGQLREEANRLMFYQPINLAFTPQDIRSEDISIGMGNTSIRNKQAQSDYDYAMKYGGSKTSGIFGGLLGGGLGALGGGAMTGFNPMAMLSGAGMGAQVGGGIGGSYGGAEGQGMGGMFGGLGQSMQTFAGSMGGIGGSSGSTGGIFGGGGLGGGGGSPYPQQYQNNFKAASRPFTIGGTP